jgi:hypothetical protein
VKHQPRCISLTSQDVSRFDVRRRRESARVASRRITSSCSCHAGTLYVTAPIEDTGSRKSTRAPVGAQLMSNALDRKNIRGRADSGHSATHAPRSGLGRLNLAVYSSLSGRPGTGCGAAWSGRTRIRRAATQHEGLLVSERDHPELLEKPLLEKQPLLFSVSTGGLQLSLTRVRRMDAYTTSAQRLKFPNRCPNPIDT